MRLLPESTAVLVSIVALATLAAPAAAYHAESGYFYEYYVCASSEGRHVHVDCNVEERLYLDIPVPEGAPGTSATTGADSQGLIAPVPGGRVPLSSIQFASVRPYDAVLNAHYATQATTDPVLEHFEAMEVAGKILLFDLLESTGLHFRLVCGWDLTETAGTCAYYNPEADAETARGRAIRDEAVEDGIDAAAASLAGVARANAPSATVEVAVETVQATAALTPPAPDLPVDDVVAWEASSEAYGVESPTGKEPDDLAWEMPADGPGRAFADRDPGALRHVLTPPPEDADATVEALSAAPPADLEMGVGAAIVAAAAAGGLALFLLVVLAHRYLTGKNLFDNDTRQLLYDSVKANPGATISDLARISGVRHATATYHLRVLEKLALVVSERIGNKTHYFGNGHIGNHEERLRRLLPGMGKAQEVVRVLEAAGPSRPADLAPRVGITVPGVYWHLKRLQELGVVTSVPGEGGLIFRVTEAFRGTPPPAEHAPV